ncbi:hypothetical protein BSKO_01946 [Bryopsis sp. KO-2023]|nr:hypothetical protein BSKO_01946 [Bryopsis sp. KO-2023]
MFVQKRNDATGKLELVQIGVDDSDGDSGMDDCLRALLSSSSYLDMLNDTRRNRAYRMAIERAVKPGDTIFDIGTGTGLLAMLAAKALGTGDGKVIAFELFPPMARFARTIVKANLLEEKILIQAKRSSDADDKDQDLADLVITEIFDSELLGEGLLPTMRHATKHLMKPGCQVIPHMAIIKCQLVQSDVISKWKGGRGCGNFEKFHECHVNALWPNHIQPLSDPFDAFTFYLGNPPGENGKMDVQVQISSSGSVDAVLLWWELYFDPEKDICLSTEPAWIDCQKVDPLENVPQGWRDHWKQCWAPVTLKPSKAGDIVTVSIRHDEISIQVAVNSQRGIDPGNLNSCGLSTLHRSDRLWAIRDATFQESHKKGLELMFGSLGQDLEGEIRCLCFSEGTHLLDMVASAMPRGRITSVQETIPGMKMARKYSKSVQSRIQIDTAIHTEETSKLVHSQVDCVIAEPFFLSRRGELPWRHFLLFARRCRELHTHGNSTLKVQPSGARIMCCLASLPEYRQSRQPLSSVEGLDLSLVSNALGAASVARAGCPLELLPRSVWNCGEGYAEVSPRTALCQISILGSEFRLERSVTSIPITGNSEACDALIVWMDVMLDDEGSIVVSGGPNTDGSPHHTVQGVALLPRPSQGYQSHQVKLCIEPSPDFCDFLFTLA